MLAGQTWMIASAVIAVATWVQASTGFGMSIVALPVLTLLDAPLVPFPLLVLGLLAVTFVGATTATVVDRPTLVRSISGAVPGAFLGAAAVAIWSTTVVVPCALAVLALQIVLLVGRWQPPRSTTVMLAIGLLSGVFSSATSVNGPLIALVHSDRPFAEMRANVAAFIWCTGVLSVLFLAVTGAVDGHQLRWCVALVPAVLLGIALSRTRATRLRQVGSRPIVLAVSVAGVVAITVSQLAG